MSVIMHIVKIAAGLFVTAAVAAPDFGLGGAAAAADGGMDVVRLAPGFSWSFTFGQIMQVGGVIATMIILWSKGQVRHAMLMRDLSEMKKDQNAIQSRVSSIENNQARMHDYLLQLPAILVATERGQKPIIPHAVLKRENERAHAAYDPFAEALREEMKEDPKIKNEIIDDVMEAIKKVMGVKE